MTIIKQGELKGKINETLYIKPNETSFVNFPIEISIKSIEKTIFDIIMNNDKYNYSLTLNAFIETTQPYEQSFKIDVSGDGNMELIK
jgi:hypothetical protein